MPTRTTACAVAALVFALTACGSSDDDSGAAAGDPTTSAQADESTGTSDPPEEWSLGPIEPSEDEGDDPVQDDEPAPSDGDDLGEVEATGDSDTVADEVDLTTEDPCGYISLTAFATWAGVDEDDAHTVPLEAGTVCGYVTDADLTRLALGMIPRAEGTGFLPDDVDGDSVDIGGRSGTWVTQYPVPESSVLVVPLDASDLVIEVSDRSGMSAEDQRSGAVAFARAALGDGP